MNRLLRSPGDGEDWDALQGTAAAAGGGGEGPRRLPGPRELRWKVWTRGQVLVSRGRAGRSCVARGDS